MKHVDTDRVGGSLGRFKMMATLLRCMSSDSPDGPLNQAALRRVLQQYPVRLGVLVGSQARGTSGPHSDVDLLVEFTQGLSADRRRRVRFQLLADCAAALGTDDIDVIPIDGVHPRIGASALADGVVLVGDSTRAERFHAAFERLASTRTHPERLAQFDAVLERLDETV